MDLNGHWDGAWRLPGETAWRQLETAEAVYTREFTAAGTEKDPVLIFEGLDVYAQVYLNGQKLGECDDMFIPWEFPVAGLLREGVNRLEVRFIPR